MHLDVYLKTTWQYSGRGIKILHRSLLRLKDQGVNKIWHTGDNFHQKIIGQVYKSVIRVPEMS